MTSPEAIKNVKEKHIRTLERRMRHLEGMQAIGTANDWDHAEIWALRIAVAELNELILQRAQAQKGSKR